MIIGNGLLAKAFRDHEVDNKLLIFASGVSNSSETSLKAFEREEGLLVKALKEHYLKKIVYFSTCSIYDSFFDKSAYTNHKINMKNIIQKISRNYIIIRLPQVLGMNNKYQLIGFLCQAIKDKKKFDLFNIERNIIDIEDVKLIADYIIEHNIFKNRIVNIANPKNIKVLELVDLLKRVLKIKPRYTIVDKTGSLDICINDIRFIIDELNLFHENYIKERVSRYCERID
jgi:UDP-2-acetamido-2,6-beta-L-arabino-hexul-4-ose reductase